MPSWISGKEPSYESGVGPGKEDLGSLGGALDVHHIDLEPLSHSVSLAGDLLVGGEYSFGAAHVDEHGAVGDPLDYAGDYLGLTGDVVVVDHSSFGLAYPLDDNLLGYLSGNAPEIPRGDHVFDDVADLVVRVYLLSFLKGYLAERIFDILNYVSSYEDVYVAGLPVYVHADILGSPVVLLICGYESALDGAYQHILGHVLFSFQIV